MLLNEDGAVFQTATEWLQWRDRMAFLMASRPDVHADVMGPFLRSVTFQQRADVVRAIGYAISQSEIVIWEEDKWRAATNGADAWIGAPAPDVPVGTPIQIWTFPTDTRATEEQKRALELEDGYDLTAVLFFPVPKVEPNELEQWYQKTTLPPGDWRGQSGWTMTLIFAPDQKILARLSPAEVGKNPLPVAYRLRPFHAIDGGAPIPPHYAHFFAGQQFMNLSFVQREPVPTTRQQRREYQRKHPENSSSVQIVTLRRVKAERDEEREREAREVERHCQWLVRGHWRRRHERWKSSDAPIWVKPHIKGPDDKPLKPVRDRIVRVNR